MGLANLAKDYEDEAARKWWGAKEHPTLRLATTCYRADIQRFSQNATRLMSKSLILHPGKRRRAWWVLHYQGIRGV
jgi:hypothetical protein